MIKCSICQKKISSIDSNNAEPVNNGRCCYWCNLNVVIQARLEIK